MSTEKTKGTNTGAPAPADASRKGSDATDPLQAPQMDASPERFLSEEPEHIKALGDDAPPKPAMPKRGGRLSKIAEEEAELASKGLVRVRLHDHGGWYNGITMKNHAAGEEIDVTPEQKALLKSHKLLQPRLMPDEDDAPVTTMDRSSLRR
jgi:hypothetical protein